MGNAGYGNHTEDTKTPGEANKPGEADKSGDAKKPGDAKRPQAAADQDSSKARPAGAPPAVGPHGEPSLTNPDATPGTGALPDVGDRDATDSTSS